MENCLHDVVLGRNFLQASRAFTRYENFFRISEAAKRRIKFWAGVSFVPRFLSALEKRHGKCLGSCGNTPDVWIDP
jgi:hypothetical protein